MNFMAQKRSGFTLIELSIVLVIIGLIVGGVLVGRDLITNAQSRSLISLVERYKAAVYTFRGKYDGIWPGDMKVADTNRFGLWGSACVGALCGASPGDPDGHGVLNGDNVIYMGDSQGETLGGTCAGECAALYRHLSDAKLAGGGFGFDLSADANPQTMIAGRPDNRLYMPASPFPDTFMAVASLYYSDTYGPVAGATLRSMDQNAFYFVKQGKTNEPILTPKQAMGIDQKIDDGKPATGSFLMERSSYFSNPLFTTTATSGACVYNVNYYASNTFASGIYNTNDSTGGNVVSCIPEFEIK